ncbi:hypothetical protein, partial [Anaerovibrio lipolyticus]|uniref:hypothetical protein n=1 Tax=Anaerovibrio lipolyticus TaxID=82374 RepID=UPI0026EFFE4B
YDTAIGNGVLSTVRLGKLAPHGLYPLFLKTFDIFLKNPAFKEKLCLENLLFLYSKPCNSWAYGVHRKS